MPAITIPIYNIVMSDIFADVREEREVEEISGQPIGAKGSELLYADDTAIFGETCESLEKLLHRIEYHSEKRGLKLNRKKCVHIRMNGAGTIIFVDGSELEQKVDATYLGTKITEDAKGDREINRRIGECGGIMKNLDPVWGTIRQESMQ